MKMMIALISLAQGLNLHQPSHPTQTQYPTAKKTYNRRKTRGQKEYSGALVPTQPPPRPAPAPQYQSGYFSDLNESVSGLSISDKEPSSTLADSIFGFGPSQPQPQPQPLPPQQPPYGSYGYGESGVAYTPSGYDAGGGYIFPAYGYVLPTEGASGGYVFPACGYVYGGESSAPSSLPPTVPSIDDQEKDLMEFFPKHGMLKNVYGQIYLDHVETYNRVYRHHLSWKDYVDRINEVVYGQPQPQQQPPRHSSFN